MGPNQLSLVVSFTYIAISLGIYVVLKQREFLSRKVLHMLIGNAVFIPLWLGADLWAAALPPLLSAAGNWVSCRRGFWDDCVGIVTYPLSVAGLMVAGYAWAPVYVLLPTLILAYGDALASLVGRLVFSTTEKSWQGSTVMFAASWALSLIWLRPTAALLLAAVATLMEGHRWDNLTVPAGTLLVLRVLLS